MCGILGKFFFDTLKFHEDDLDKMLDSIVHRGPDSEGRFCDGRALIGFRRLSIIDTISGDQPLVNEDGQIILIANGEIYNYRELKSLLQSHGHIFRTGSDCEVLLHLYEEYGTEFIERLNGMFAFCLYDQRKGRLLLGRDRVGIKPLYFSVQDGLLIFASEIKAILQATEVTAEQNTDVLDEYLCFRFLSGNRTFFKGINILEPGTFLEAHPDGWSISHFWQPSVHEDRIAGSKAVKLIRENLQDSVRRQLMSDVPLGTQLSGGVDSSWVSLLAAREAPGMKSFSVRFSEAAFDETPDAKVVAAEGGLEYHEVMSDPSNFALELPRIIWHNDEPLTHANSLEIFNLCRFAREHVKVLLTGEGADELFAGYPRYYLCRFAHAFKSLPPLFQPVFRFGLDQLSRGRGKKPSRFLEMLPRDLIFWNAAFCDPKKVAWFLDKKELQFGVRRALLDRIWTESRSLLDNLLLFEFQSYLRPILLRQDKMSMGASIEARVPILDNAMIDLAFRIPAEEKIKNFRPKFLFKRAAEKDVPRKIVYKRKIGFGVPVGAWMRGQGTLSVYLDRLLDERRHLPGIHSDRLEKIVHEHRHGVKDHQDILWPLINYSIWRDIYLRPKGVS
jgi:asparagine synthase (glutamine-hydrolysing)